MSWETVIGLEIHAQLSTKSKIFSGSATAYGKGPNTQANLVDLAYPGVLPVLNGEVVRMAVKFGLAVDAPGSAAFCFRAQELLLSGPSQGLPDQPVRFADRQGPHSTIVMEDGAEDESVSRAPTWKKTRESRCTRLRAAGIDLNRAGTPLIEIVSEPDLRSRKKPWIT